MKTKWDILSQNEPESIQWTTMTNSEPVRHNESQQVTLSHKSHNEPQNEPQKAIMSNNGT